MAVAGHLDILGHMLVLRAPLSASFCLPLPAHVCPTPHPLGSSCSPMATPQGPFISLMSRGESQPIQRPSGPCRVPILLVAGRGEGQLAGPDPRLCWQWGLREEWGVMGWAMGPRGGTGRWSLGGLVLLLLWLFMSCRWPVCPPQRPSSRQPRRACLRTLAVSAASRPSHLVGDNGLIETILRQQLAAL